MEDGKPVTPTLGGGVGPRLDRWLCATNEAGEREPFQIEIKNWSAHAIGGRRLTLDATDERRVAVGRHYWGRIWDQDSGTLREESARKVLIRMQLPRAYDGINADVVPLICFGGTSRIRKTISQIRYSNFSLITPRRILSG
jgi:hypothetical protein